MQLDDARDEEPENGDAGDEKTYALFDWGELIVGPRRGIKTKTI